MRRSRPSPPATYWVYAIQLDPASVKRHPQVDEVRRGAPVVYVGQSAHHPVRRFTEHLHGGVPTSSVVTKYGVALLAYEGPFPSRPRAEREESRLAHALRREGFVIYSG